MNGMRTTVPLFALLVACTGGGGALSSDGLVTQDPAPISNEPGGNQSEGAALSNEVIKVTNELPSGTSTDAPPGGAASVGGFSCIGTFSCTITVAGTGSVTVPISLPACGANGAAINADGTITKDGQVVATWHPTANGFSYSGTTTESTTTFGSDGQQTTTTKQGYAFTANCVKTSDVPTNTTGDDDDSTTTKTPVVTIDAGASR
jgi:hypothetical protein